MRSIGLAMLAALLAWPQAARAEWLRATSPQFVVYGDMSRPQIEAFAAKLERFDMLLRRMTGLDAPPPPNRLTVFLVKDTAAVQRQLGPGGRNVAGFYHPSIAGTIAVVPETSGSGEIYSLDAQTVLFHEYAHHFMLQYYPGAYPAWYVEGFAEFYSTTRFKADGEVSTGFPARHRYYGLVADQPFPVARMFAADRGRMTGNDTGRFYAWSWLLTHYLALSPDRKGQLTTYLNAFAAGTPPVDAATNAFGDLAKLQADLVRYRDARRISFLELKAFPTPTVRIDVVPAGAAATMPLVLHFMRGSRGPADVASFVGQARKLAPRYPGDPRMLELLAEGELDAKAFDAATTANDALLALRPTDARALLRRARIAAARLGESKDADAWRAVRILVAKANRVAPDDPFPLAEYFRTYVAADVAPPKLAVDGLSRAVELAPQVSSLRFSLAKQLMRQGERARARIVATPLLNDPHSASLRDAARALLAGEDKVKPPADGDGGVEPPPAGS